MQNYGKVVLVVMHSFSLCDSIYKVAKKLHSCMLISPNTKNEGSLLNMTGKWM